MGGNQVMLLIEIRALMVVVLVDPLVKFYSISILCCASKFADLS
jgi:hypothetical protein